MIKDDETISNHSEKEKIIEKNKDFIDCRSHLPTVKKL